MNRFIQKGMLGLLSICACSTAAYADPRIDSVTITDGAEPELIIRGSGFGRHPDFSGGQAGFLAAGWHDFENGNLEGGNVYRDSHSPRQWSVESSSTRPGSRYHAQKVLIDNELGELAVDQRGTTGDWYVSFWMHLNNVADQQSGKFFRIYGDRSNIYVSAGGGSLDIRGFSECGFCSPAPNTVWGSPESFKGRTWHRVEIEISEQPDMFAIYMDGVLQWRRSSTLSGDEREKWMPNPFGGDGHTVGIGQMLDDRTRGYPTNGWYRFDDYYVTYTKARVELSNQSTWSAARRRELQVPFEWASQEVRARFRQGALSAEPLYLYVIDENGQANSNGFPLTEGGATAKVPKPPTDLRAEDF